MANVTKKRAAPKKAAPKKAAPEKAAPKKKATPKKATPKKAAKPKPATPRPTVAPPPAKSTQVTIDTMTNAQLRKLQQLAKEAGDELEDYCKVALDPKTSDKKRREALELCVETWNDLENI